METSGRSEPEVCPICFEPLRREAYLDRCFHAFCYHCIVQWSEFVKEKYRQSAPSVKCPLCKVENLSIVYSFDGESFRRFYLNGDCQDSFFTSGHEFRLQCYSSEPGNIFNVQRYWKHHRYRQKNIWLPSWLRREIQTLTKEEDVDIIFHHVHGVIEAFFRRIFLTRSSLDSTLNCNCLHRIFSSQRCRNLPLKHCAQPHSNPLCSYSQEYCAEYCYRDFCTVPPSTLLCRFFLQDPLLATSALPALLPYFSHGLLA